jgi:D-amino-acid dehydrogenase
MKVLIIGAGLIGITSAYFLIRRGYDVTVLDRRAGPGLETSFANGALLTPSMSQPWNTPGCWRVLLASLIRSDSPLQLRYRTLPCLVDWGIGFLRNSRPTAFERNTLSNLRLSLYSLNLMQVLRDQIGIEYSRTARGSLRLFRNPASFEHATKASAQLSSHGITIKTLTPQQTATLEPALAPIANQLAGAIHYAHDEVGDAHRFCVALADKAREQGVEFRFGTPVTSLEMHAGHVAAVVTAQRRLVADRYIVAAGSYSTPLLRSTGIRLPARPAKGYSITFEPRADNLPLNTPLVDDELHAVLVPLDGTIRIAGTAEFAGYDLTLPPTRIQNLLTLAQQLLPNAQLDPTTARPWCGLRPMSPDGTPIIGPTPIANLYINTGHGHLGWTMAAGSAQLLTDLICHNTPSIDPIPSALNRFDG